MTVSTLPERFAQYNALMEIRKDLGSNTPGLTPEDLQQVLFPHSERSNCSEDSKDPQPGPARAPSS